MLHSYCECIKERFHSSDAMTRMSSSARIVQLMMNNISQQPSNSLPHASVNEEEVATHLLELLDSLLTSDSYTHEYETTLDYSISDSELDGCEMDPDDPIRGHSENITSIGSILSKK